MRWMRQSAADLLGFLPGNQLATAFFPGKLNAVSAIDWLEYTNCFFVQL
jgi:hypothetical protein